MSVVRPMKRDGQPAAGSLPSRELQELWFATRRRDWRSLVLVPASPGRSALPVAQALGNVGGLIRMGPVQVINAEGVELDRVANIVMDMGEPLASQPAGRDSALVRAPPQRATIVVVEPVVTNPLVLPIALAADAVLLCIYPGETDLDGARHTIELIGREHIIGSVLIR
jgi:hypothetical protein